MERSDLREADYSNMEQGYADQGELTRDLCIWLDLVFFHYYQNHRWLGPDSSLKNMLGLVVSQEEFEHQLTRSSRMGLCYQLTEGEREELRLKRMGIAIRLKHTETDFPLCLLFRRCALDEFQQSCVLLAWAVAEDRKYEKILAYLQDDMGARGPTCSLAAELFVPYGASLEEYQAWFLKRDRFTALFQPEPLEQGKLVLRESVRCFLAEGSVPDRVGLHLFDPAEEKPSHSLVIQGEIARYLDRVLEDPAECCVLLNGPDGSGKRFQIEHLCNRRQQRCVFADLRGNDWEERARDAALAALLTGSWLCLYHLDREQADGEGVSADRRPPDAAMLSVLEQLETGKPKRFFLSRLPIRSRMKSLEVEISIPAIGEQERLDLFRACLRGKPLAEDCQPERLASTFHFSPLQIVRACQQAEGLAMLQGERTISDALMHQCCYRQAVHKLGDLASAVPPAYQWEDVVMPEAQKRLLQQACAHVLYQHQVYYRWGFDAKVRYGRGLSVLFAGAPGTGKTMCAQVIANQLHMELYKINLSQIVSKYIGETEKNLRAVFTEARNANSILFFDECDALFGKRSEVKDSHDRNANVEVAYLLQQIEEYDGVCILATNLIGNIDAAFMRRITYVVHFPFPDPPMREQIYRRMIPKAAAVSDDIDWRFLAEKFELSGGHIKNIVLGAAFMAAGQGEEISMKHMLRAAVNEMKKNEIVVVRETLREYADLLDGDS